MVASVYTTVNLTKVAKAKLKQIALTRGKSSAQCLEELILAAPELQKPWRKEGGELSTAEMSEGGHQIASGDSG